MIAAAAELARGPLLRVLLLGLLAVLLQIPGSMIGQLMGERQRSRDDAAAEIAQTWGGSQRLAGPVLVVPYQLYGLDDKGKRVETESGAIAFLPDRLDIAADAQVETLRRGLYEIPVYRGRLRLNGRFKAPLTELGTLLPRDALRWEQAQLVLKVADVHALDRVAPLQAAGVSRDFQGGAGALGGSGLHAPLPGVSGSAPFDFSVELSLRGSDSLQFAPSARAMQVQLGSRWPHPKFYGVWLPEHREVGAEGFTARWQVTSLAGGLPAAWKLGRGEGEALDGARFGVQLLYPVDPYRMSDRSLKYDLLFIGLTFVVLWLFEQRAGRSVRPIQYLLVGSALCLFYLLELSLAEHLGFAAAYGIAAAAVTAQVALYGRAVLRGSGPALLLLLAVAGLYALLYVMLGAEDYALLIGSVLLFATLSLVMFVTRRADTPPPS